MIFNAKVRSVFNFQFSIFNFQFSMIYLLLIIGFVILIYGANYLVDGAVGIAKRFKISDLIIGLTIVAFGTSSPELIVNLVAAMDATTTDIALTNIIGSNTINIFIVLGAAALIYPVKSQKDSRKFDIPLCLLATLIIFLPVYFRKELDIMFGVVLLLIFSFFMFITARKALKMRVSQSSEIAEKTVKQLKTGWYTLMIIGGLILLVIGGKLIVNSATAIAVSLGVSQSIIGLTIVALGTSLPELATSVIAALKKNSDIALGNVIGSNIFNVFFVLGISACIRPLPAYENIMIDLSMATLGSLFVLIFVLTNKKNEIKRWEGGLLLCIYFGYLAWMITNIR